MQEDPIAAAVAQKRLGEASSAVQKTKEKLNDQYSENRQAYEKFHFNLALFSGGTIALSLTFLGYLKSLPNHAVAWPWILVGSWIVLFVCLIVALFHSFFYSHYAHFSAAGDYLSSLVKDQQTVADAMDDVDLVNLSEEQKNTQREKHRKNAEIYRGKRDTTRKKEKRYLGIWIWCGRVARFAFPIGLGLLVLFAIANMDLPSFTMWGHKPKRVSLSYLEKYGDDGQETDLTLFGEERLGWRISQNKGCMLLTHNKQMADYTVDISVVRGLDLYTSGGPEDRIFATASLSITKQNGDVILTDSFHQNLKSIEDIGQQPITKTWDVLCQGKGL